MKFIKWFLKENPFHIAIFLIGYFAMFVLWGDDGADTRPYVVPIWTLILAVLVIGKYRYWVKVVKDNNTKIIK